MIRALALATALISSTALAQFCPCYTLSSTSNNNNCGVEAVTGTNPTVAQWQPIFDLVSKGPAAWGSNGPAVGDIGQGCGKPMPSMQVPAKFPCELLKAIATVETGWRQFCVPSTPADQAGKSSRTIISFDCGYGIGQVTSGMHIGEAPAFDRARVASDPTYNLATGTQILAGKWRATRCVGDNQPSIIEHWYSATWAYNGLAYSNNPNNPNYSTTRGVYRPGVTTTTRPYQEKVFGYMEYPPSAAHWTSLPFAYPKLTDIGNTSSPNTLPEPNCASPVSCTSTRPTHVSSCFQQTADAGTGGGGGATGGGAGTGGGTATGGGSGTGGGTGTGGGGMTPIDAGTGGGGGSLPVDVDAGTPDPVTVPFARSVIGPATGCGCTAVPEGWLLFAAALLLRRRR